MSAVNFATSIQGAAFLPEGLGPQVPGYSSSQGIFPRGTIKSLFASIMGIDVRTNVEPEPQISPVTQARCIITVGNRTGLGWDEHRYTLQPNGNLIDRLNGVRTVVVSAKVESFSTLDNALQADDYLEVLRTLIYEDAARATLHLVNLSVAEDHNIQSLPTGYDTNTCFDNRVVTAAQCDFLFNWGVAIQTSQVGPGSPGWVQSVNGTNTLPIT